MFANKEELLASATCFFKPHHAPFPPSNHAVSFRRQEYGLYKGSLAYLLPTISSLCAIHKTLHGESQSLDTFAEAVQLNIAASNSFRHAEHSVHAGNWLSMLMFGVSHIMFNFAAAQAVPECAFDYLCVFHVLRSTDKIACHIGEFFERSELNNILQKRRQRVTDFPIYDDSLSAMNHLSMAAHPKHTSEIVRAHCEKALESLKWWAWSVNGVPQIWKHFIMWPGSVTDGFVAALGDKQPVALLIYIYWCTIMRRAPRRWYGDGWQQRVASAAMSELDRSYDELLEWPIFTLSSEFHLDTTSKP